MSVAVADGFVESGLSMKTGIGVLKISTVCQSQWFVCSKVFAHYAPNFVNFS